MFSMPWWLSTLCIIAVYLTGGMAYYAFCRWLAVKWTGFRKVLKGDDDDHDGLIIVVYIGTVLWPVALVAWTGYFIGRYIMYEVILKRVFGSMFSIGEKITEGLGSDEDILKGKAKNK